MGCGVRGMVKGMRGIQVLFGFLLALVLLAPALEAEDARPLPAGRAAGRTFQLNYGATLHDLPAGGKVRVWLPVPQTNDHQRIRSLKMDLPARGQFSTDGVHGNRILYFETSSPGSGSLAFNTAYLVRRREVQALEGLSSRARLSAGQKQLYLSANKKVPLVGKPLDLLAGVEFATDPLLVARLLWIAGPQCVDGQHLTTHREHQEMILHTGTIHRRVKRGRTPLSGSWSIRKNKQC